MIVLGFRFRHSVRLGALRFNLLRAQAQDDAKRRAQRFKAVEFCVSVRKNKN